MSDALTLIIMWVLSLVASVSTGIAVDLWRKYRLLEREFDRLYDELVERRMKDHIAKIESVMNLIEGQDIPNDQP